MKQKLDLNFLVFKTKGHMQVTISSLTRMFVSPQYQLHLLQLLQLNFLFFNYSYNVVLILQISFPIYPKI